MGTLKYDSNNSGGDWWLKDEHWEALEAGGWTVEWNKDSSLNRGADRFLGALASNASKEFATKEEGMEEWSKITGADCDELGCSCCGPPHSFEWEEDGKISYGHPVIQKVSMGWG